tara:strand:- start:356 stop:2896 length:2541 start_codon:yes stop_codon:yes gene_type:complete
MSQCPKIPYTSDKRSKDGGRTSDNVKGQTWVLSEGGTIEDTGFVDTFGFGSAEGSIRAGVHPGGNWPVSGCDFDNYVDSGFKGSPCDLCDDGADNLCNATEMCPPGYRSGLIDISNNTIIDVVKKKEDGTDTLWNSKCRGTDPNLIKTCAETDPHLGGYFAGAYLPANSKGGIPKCSGSNADEGHDYGVCNEEHGFVETQSKTDDPIHICAQDEKCRLIRGGYSWEKEPGDPRPKSTWNNQFEYMTRPLGASQSYVLHSSEDEDPGSAQGSQYDAVRIKCFKEGDEYFKTDPVTGAPWDHADSILHKILNIGDFSYCKNKSAHPHADDECVALDSTVCSTNSKCEVTNSNGEIQIPSHISDILKKAYHKLLCCTGFSSYEVFSSIFCGISPITGTKVLDRGICENIKDKWDELDVDKMATGTFCNRDYLNCAAETQRAERVQPDCAGDNCNYDYTTVTKGCIDFLMGGDTRPGVCKHALPGEHYTEFINPMDHMHDRSNVCHHVCSHHDPDTTGEQHKGIPYGVHETVEEGKDICSLYIQQYCNEIFDGIKSGYEKGKTLPQCTDHNWDSPECQALLDPKDLHSRDFSGESRATDGRIEGGRLDLNAKWNGNISRVKDTPDPHSSMLNICGTQFPGSSGNLENENVDFYQWWLNNIDPAGPKIATIVNKMDEMGMQFEAGPAATPVNSYSNLIGATGNNPIRCAPKTKLNNRIWDVRKSNLRREKEGDDWEVRGDATRDEDCTEENITCIASLITEVGGDITVEGASSIETSINQQCGRSDSDSDSDSSSSSSSSSSSGNADDDDDDDDDDDSIIKYGVIVSSFLSYMCVFGIIMLLVVVLIKGGA